MAHREGWEVGMMVVVVERRYNGNPRIYDDTITKVGRRWITLASPHSRFDAETMVLDGRGYASPGRVWPTMRDYEDAQEANQAWSDLRRALPSSPPKGMTISRIHEIILEISQ